MLAPGQIAQDNQDLTEAHWVDVADGRLHVRTSGEGPLVIFLHGWTLDWRIWSPQLPLARYMQLVLPDRRGFGRSTAPPKLVAERDDIDIIADYFGADKFSLVGLSQGAAVALDYARTHPDRLYAAVLIGAPLHGLVPEPAATSEIDRATYSALVRAGKLSEMLSEWRSHPLTFVSDAGKYLLDQILADYDGRDQHVDQEPLVLSDPDFASLTMPMLAIAGEDDSLWRQQVAKFIGTNAWNGTTGIIAKAGHIANIDQPETINIMLENFLSQHQKGI